MTNADPQQGAKLKPRLPLQPLLDALPIDPELAKPDVIGPGVIAQAAVMLDVSTRTLHRLHHEGLNPWTADRLAVAAGSHPLLVWGDPWVEALTAKHVSKTEHRAATYGAARSS